MPEHEGHLTGETECTGTPHCVPRGAEFLVEGPQQKLVDLILQQSLTWWLCRRVVFIGKASSSVVLTCD